MVTTIKSLIWPLLIHFSAVEQM